MTTTLEHTYMLSAIEIHEFASYSGKKFLIVARASDLLAESASPVPRTILPTHANLREPSAKSIAVKEILSSIEKNLFHEISDPIQVACKSVKQYLGKPVNGKQERGLFMVFDDVTDGVMDGAHRLHALWLAKLKGFNLDNVRVTLMVSEGVDITAKCLELNTYSAPTKIALMDKAGSFDHIKDLYADSFPFIRYRDNQSGTSDYPLCAVRNIDMLLRRCTGKTIQPFSRQSRGALGADKAKMGLFSGVNNDLKYWALLHDIYPTLVFLFELFEKAAIAQESRFLSVPRNATLYAQLMDGRKFAVKVSSQQLIYLLMSALSVNYNQETGNWNVPLNKIGKKLINAAWQEFKSKHTQVRFHGSASAVIADPRMAELILAAADQAYAKYVDRESDSIAA